MDYDYSKISEREKSLLPFGFQGNVYNLSYKWQEIFPGTENPVKILEIGGYHGRNVCSLTKTYAVHTSSEIHVIDPWQDYDGYNEYKDKQNNNYSIFIKNISKLPAWDLSKIYLHRMKSEDFRAIFMGNETIVPRPSDLSYYSWESQVCYINDSPNFKTDASSEEGLMFRNKRDRKLINVNPAVASPGDGTDRTEIESPQYT